MANFECHYQTTGPEIYTQMQGSIDAFIMGAGTGGTIAGVSHYLKPRIPNIKIILADPQGSGLYNKVQFHTLYSINDAEGTRKRHQVDTMVEGIGLTRLTANFTHALPLIDDAIKVSDQEMIEMCRFLLDKDGLFGGSSFATHCVAALKWAKKNGPGKKIVTICCDSGSRYLSKLYNDEYVKKRGLSVDSNLLGLK